MNEEFWSKFTSLIESHVRKLLSDWGFFNMYDDGKIESISTDQRKANVYVNGSTDITRDIPIREGVSLSVGDEVRILNVNFNKKDRIIDFKKII